MNNFKGKNDCHKGNMKEKLAQNKKDQMTD